MPLYDYKCPKCNHRFEAQHGMNADAPPCPACGYADVERIITSAPTVAGGMATPAGSSRGATKEELRDKWSAETPKLRKKLVDKLGEDTVRKNAPHLFSNSDD